MTPQSELQRLLGIPPDLWEVELKGMSDEMLIDVIVQAVGDYNRLEKLLTSVPEDRAVDIAVALMDAGYKEST